MSVLNFPANPASQTPAFTYSPTSSPDRTTNGVTYVFVDSRWKATAPGSGGGADGISYEYPGSGFEQTVQGRLQQYVSVADFDARGDDFTDDTAAIQAAIDAVTDTGGTVMFPAGTYIISSTIRIYQKTHLIGNGGFFQNQFSGDFRIGGTTIKLAPGSNCDMILIRMPDADDSADKRTHCSIRNMQIFGNRSADNNPGANDLNQIGNGIVISGARYISLENVICIKCAESGLECESYTYPSGSISSNNLDIRGCAFHSNAGNGADLIAGDSVFSGNTVGYNNGYGIQATGWGNVGNNLIWNNKNGGVYFVSTANGTVNFVGNKVYDNRESGLILSSPDGSANIVGNRIIENGGVGDVSKPSEVSGIFISSQVTEGINITGNEIHGNPYGIYFNNPTVRCTGFSGNSITASSIQDLKLDDPENIVLHGSSANGLLHVGFKATDDIDLNGNKLLNFNNFSLTEAYGKNSFSVNSTGKKVLDLDQPGTMYFVTVCQTNGNAAGFAYVHGDDASPVIISQESATSSSSKYVFSITGTELFIRSDNNTMTSNYRILQIC